MAPTGPITSWQILLEINAASSRSVGSAPWAICKTSGLVADEAARPDITRTGTLAMGNRLRTGVAVIHALRLTCQGSRAQAVWVLFFRHYFGVARGGIRPSPP